AQPPALVELFVIFLRWAHGRNFASTPSASGRSQKTVAAAVSAAAWWATRLPPQKTDDPQSRPTGGSSPASSRELRTMATASASRLSAAKFILTKVLRGI